MAFANNYPTLQVSQTIPPIQYEQNMPMQQTGPYTPPIQQYITQPQSNYNIASQPSMANICQPTINQQYNIASKSQDWQLAENKKRPRKDSPEKSQVSTKQTRITDYWLSSPITTSNRFAPLNNKNEQQEKREEKNKEPKPPPIFVAGVNNITPLTQLLEEIGKNEYERKVLSNDQVKINPKTSEKYSAIVKALTAKNTQFHTHQTKEERSFRVVLRNMHHTTSLEALKMEIEGKGHTVTNISNIRQKITKIPLPLFYVELIQNHNNKDIYNIATLMHSKIKFEPPHQKREINQCTRCQRYGHTKKFCYHTPRCVKCMGDHHTLQCTRNERNNEVKCMLCSLNHRANYKGCLVYKELQSKKYPALRKKEVKTPQQPVNPTYISQAHSRPSYAEITRDQMQQLKPLSQIQFALPQQTNNIFELKQMMKGLMEQMGTMLNLLTTLVSRMAQ